MKSVPKIILLFSVEREYPRGIYRGIAKYSRDHGPWDFLMRMESGRASELKKWRPDGIIAHGSDELNKVLPWGVPVIGSILDKNISEAHVIKPNNQLISSLAVKH